MYFTLIFTHSQQMAKEDLIRCVSIKTGKPRMLIPLLANDAIRLEKLGFIRAELEAPPKTIPPTPDKPTSPPAEINIHKVSKGDTYAKLARANGITVKELKGINNINGEPITSFTALKIK